MISDHDELYQIFMCQNDPGMCDDWDANSGGNAVIVTKLLDLESAEVPTEGVTLREAEYSAKVVVCEGSDYDEARSQWAEMSGVSTKEVLGQLHGDLFWIQNEETPMCNKCNRSMEFVAQLEQGPDWKTEMNFGGGGMGYLFRCHCNSMAKFLWQC